MTSRILFSFSLLLLTASVYAQTTLPVKPDSSATTVKKAAPQAKNTDEDLILDDNDKSILPIENKKPAAQAAPAARAATVAADTGLKKTAAASIDTSAAKTAAAGQAAKPQTQVLVKDTAKKVTDEELILEGGEENLINKEKTVQYKPSLPGQSGTTGTGNDSSAAAAAGKQNQGTVSLPTPAGFADSATKTSQASGANAGAPLPAATIESVHSINFARNLKEYRSPKLAMLMSLILPGAGQVYAKSNLWAAAFGVIEVGLISTGVALSAKSKTVSNNAHAFANQHYDTNTYKQYTTYLKSYLHSINDSTSYSSSIFFEGEDTSFLSEARNKSDLYYNNINSRTLPYIRGWDDVQTNFTNNGYQIQGSDTSRFGIVTGPKGDTSYLLFLKPDSTNRMYGISANQVHYNSMLDESRKWANYSRNTFLSLLLNHLASAIMAGIAAKRHNDELLGRESFWHHIEVEPCYVNTGSGTSPGYAVQVEF
ncbi:MAG: hypothetical protein ABSF80_09990 [Chitinispirillaceae bacterium]|jgi:hypothetical protein